MTRQPTFESGADPLGPDDDVLLVELVDRLLDRGVVLSGQMVISLAGVDLVYVGLRLLVASVESLRDADAGRDALAAGPAG